jgi:hypothetical protein
VPSSSLSLWWGHLFSSYYKLAPPGKFTLAYIFGGLGGSGGTVGISRRDKGRCQRYQSLGLFGALRQARSFALQARVPQRPLRHQGPPGSGTPAARGGERGGARRYLGRPGAGGGLSRDGRQPPHPDLHRQPPGAQSSGRTG